MSSREIKASFAWKKLVLSKQSKQLVLKIP